MWTELRAEIAAHLAGDGLAPVTTLTADGLPTARGPAAVRGGPRRRPRAGRAEPISVVIATRDRPGPLARCLASVARPRLRALRGDRGRQRRRRRPPADLVARDAPCGPLVREERPGLALAHNRGVAEASGSILAFTDDDVIADPLWLARIARAFEHSPGVGCVTGLILPVELESAAQVWIDDYWGFDKGLERRVFGGDQPSDQPLYPYTAGVFGSGANMAFSAAALRARRLRRRIGTGSPARGGDDLAAFFDLIAGGHRSSTAHRRRLPPDRPDYASLKTQAYGYGVGLSAYIARTLADDPRRVLEVPHAARVAYLLGPRSAETRRVARRRCPAS